MANLPAFTAADEPDWELLLDDVLEIGAARAARARVLEELRAGGRWSPVNDHAVTRLVLAWLLYDRSAAKVLEQGAVVLTPKTKVPMYNLHFSAMNAAGAEAAKLEAELLLSPRRRGKVPLKAAKPAGGTKLAL